MNLLVFAIVGVLRVEQCAFPGHALAKALNGFRIRLGLAEAPSVDSIPHTRVALPLQVSGDLFV